MKLEGNNLKSVSSELSTAQRKVMTYLALLMVVASVGACVGVLFMPLSMTVVVGVMSLLTLIVALVLKSTAKDRKGTDASKFMYYVTAFLLGISISSSIKVYLSYGMSKLIVIALIATAIMYITLAIAGYTCKADLGSLRTFLIASLFILILLSIVGLFLQFRLFHIMIAYMGILIFSAFTLYDFNSLKSDMLAADGMDIELMDIAFNLFLDFLNLFQYVLQIMVELSTD